MEVCSSLGKKMGVLPKIYKFDQYHAQQLQFISETTYSSNGEQI